MLLCFYWTFSQNGQKVFRSPDNPYYWKNKKPHEGYWQQDVHYKINVRLDDSLDIIEGKVWLRYYNNSPDELRVVFFHLYSNAQTSNSYLADLYKNNKYHLKFGKYRSEGKGTLVSKITTNETELKSEMDNTILKVNLPKPLAPNDSIDLELDFTTWFDVEAIRNRMKKFNAFGYKHFDLVHWYPRISVYDKKQGWDTDQHMDHEFYGDFGTFEVNLDLPNNYICDGTGELLNEEEVLPSELRAKLDIRNFKGKPWNSAPSEIIKRNNSRKTWKFRAINVHDAAYTMDPTYRIGETMWNGIQCIALVQEPHAALWQNASAYVAKIIETNSKLIGMYGYPKMIAADAQDGMEYPMITLNGGYDPGFRSLFIHEISHNWFFGMVGSNETYRAFMDEGFTQFFTANTWEKMEGTYDLYYTPKSKYVARYSKPVTARESNAYYRYISEAIKGDETVLNTHSDGFNGAIRHGGGYGMSYSKTAVMLYNLRYVLGDSLFYKGIRDYFNTWKFCHPYPEDMKASFTHSAGTDLNWFFDQWLETAKTIDYAIKKVKRKKRDSAGRYTYEITFKRNGRMQMPVDFTVFTKDSLAANYYIPNNWFVKPTTSTVLPRWIGWDKVKPTYKALITTSSPIENVSIDTSNTLADVNMMNNSWKKNYHFSFDSKIYNMPDRTRYEFFARPSLWYNGYDGLKFGMHLNGNYMNYHHVFDATVWVNSGMGQHYLDSTVSVNDKDGLSFLINYKTATDRFMKKSAVYFSARELDGLSAGLVGFERRSQNDKNRLYIQLKGMLRDLPKDLNYLIYKNEWSVGTINSYSLIGFDHNYSYRRGTGAIVIQLRSPLVRSDFDFAALMFSCVNKNTLGKIDINTRLFAQYGTGNRIPVESMLFASGANPEELMDNKYTRSMGFFEPFSYGKTTGHFTAGGGLNLRGYAGYLLPEISKEGDFRFNYKGTSGAAFNMEIDFGKLFSFVQKGTKNTLAFNPYLFGDAGIINRSLTYEPLSFTEPLIDAGAGFTISIQKWWKLQTVKPLVIRCDFPVFLNRLPYAEKDYLQFRWMIGVNRAF